MALVPQQSLRVSKTIELSYKHEKKREIIYSVPLPQCENYRDFLTLRFYVKSILVNLEYQISTCFRGSKIGLI